MAKVNMGTTTYANANLYGWQRKIIKTSDGNLFLFAILGTTSETRLQYKKSDDNGVTWGSWTPVYTAANVNYFDIYNDSDNLYLIFNASSNIKFIKLTYSAGSYSVGSTITVAALNYISDSITKRSDGNYWIAIHSGSTIYTYYSDDDGATWNSGGNISGGATIYGSKIIPKGSNLWILFQAGTYLKYVEYISSWGSPIEIAGALSLQATTSGFFAEKISDTDIWAGGQKYAVSSPDRVIKVWRYTGSWDAGTEISSSGTNEDKQSTISIVGGKPVIVWNENANTNINYRRFNGTSWDSIQTLDSTNVFTPVICERDDNWLYTYWLSGSGSPYIIYFDKINLNPTQTKDLSSDMYIKATGLTEDLTSDMEITNTQFKDLTSNMTIKSTEQKDLTSDMGIINDRVEVDLTSDMTISATAIKDLLSDMHIVDIYFAETNNKISFVKRAFYDITNKFSFVKKILSDVHNIITFVKNRLYDVDNDFRMNMQKLYDAKNDLRFVKSWQRSATVGFQSLGKEYVKVYFDGAEIVDDDGNSVVDVDTIKIRQVVNGIHTASFELGLPYDDVKKPDSETVVEIKYHVWTLYKGKIVNVSPTDDPESIRVDCNNKYWEDNRTNNYFFVGHKPEDDNELYYSTIKEALIAQFSWNPNIGEFVPQIMNEFSKGSADVLSDLIGNCGNYGWFYDVEENKKLWTAGAGNIVNIDRQEIGENVKLYDLVSHSLYENIEDIVNKLRVQMGEMTVRSLNNEGQRNYIAHLNNYYEDFLSKGWDNAYERLSADSLDGYGWDNPDPDYEDEFGKVYRHYSIPYLDPNFSSLSDRYPPYIEIYAPGWYYGFREGVIKEGFTIDYENREVIFSQPYVAIGYNEALHRYSFRAPVMKLFIFKEDYYTSTSDYTEDPESDIGNPLMFFTNKVGDYPTTIIDDLILSDLSKQDEMVYYSNLGAKIVVPGWDDTPFAEDLAYWSLSKTAYKKITGYIDLTIDCVCYNKITLQNRIFIDGITSSAMNIQSIDYDFRNFTVRISLENNYAYKRSVSLPLHR